MLVVDGPDGRLPRKNIGNMVSLFSLKTILNENYAGEELSNEDIKRLQQCLRMCCKELLEVCDKNGIKLILQGGTLLGYVRHNGFIPWDDDIDLGLLREDYEKFISIFNTELSDRYIMSAPKAGYPSYNRFVQVFRKGTLLREVGAEHNQAPPFVYIDIFPLDYAPDNVVARQLRGIRANILMGIGGCVQGMATMTKEEKGVMCATVNGKVLYVVRSVIGKLFSSRTPKYWFEAIDRTIACSQNTGFITSGTGRKHYLGEVIPANSIFPLQQVQFEGLSIYAPHDPDAYLKNLYGDYMAVPPEEKRERHFAIELKTL